jgi:dipeptidyl aminopeptidase/acylaminoacyl peptidase
VIVPRRWLLVSLALTVLLLAASPATAKNTVLPDFSGDEAAWSPDSGAIAVPARGGIEVRDPDGKPVRELAVRRYHPGFPCECRLGWSADSRRVLFLTHTGEIEGKVSVGSVPAAGGRPQMAALGMPIGAAAWSPGGWPLIFVPNSRAFRIGSGRIGPTPDLWRLDSLHGRPHKILAQKGEEWEPLVSPDGSQVLFTRSRERGFSSLWLVGIDGSKPHRLVADLIVSTAAWSPDGATLALTATTRRGDRRQHLYTVPAAGGPLREIFAEELIGGAPAWTPDGEWITFANYEGEIRRIHPDGTGIETIAERPGREIRGLQWSPDGLHLAFTAPIHRESD